MNKRKCTRIKSNEIIINSIVFLVYEIFSFFIPMHYRNHLQLLVKFIQWTSLHSFKSVFKAKIIFVNANELKNTAWSGWWFRNMCTYIPVSSDDQYTFVDQGKSSCQHYYILFFISESRNHFLTYCGPYTVFISRSKLTVSAVYMIVWLYKATYQAIETHVGLSSSRITATKKNKIYYFLKDEYSVKYCSAQ